MPKRCSLCKTPFVDGALVCAACGAERSVPVPFTTSRRVAVGLATAIALAIGLIFPILVTHEVGLDRELGGSYGILHLVFVFFSMLVGLSMSFGSRDSSYRLFGRSLSIATACIYPASVYICTLSA